MRIPKTERFSKKQFSDDCLIVLALVFFFVATPTHLAGLTPTNANYQKKLFGLCFQASVGKKEGERHLESEMVLPCMSLWLLHLFGRFLSVIY